MRLPKFTAAIFLLSSVAAAAAPFQSAKTLDGTAFNPKGEVTIVHYWATWCAPCRVEMPVLDALYRKHHAQGLAMLAISIDDAASTAKLKQMTSRFAFPVAKIDDVKMPRRDIPAAIPETRVYDRSGRLVFQSKADGKTTLDAATLERVVDPLLAH
jgi:thiol-disulfide isomerase/thioredoxin